jgi:uncharacterized repeat protein (TIGR01451 family)
MRSVLRVLATAVGVALLAGGTAAADTVTTNFESPTFQPGSVSGQDGWRSARPGNVPGLPNGYDQEVAPSTGAALFGQQSLRMSNLYPNGEYFFQTYSKPVASPAGENQANTEYIAQFSFIAKTRAYQSGLLMRVSPDSGEGSRMSRVDLVDTEGGIQVVVTDSPGADGDFVDHDVAGLLSHDVPHTIRFWIKVNPGENNDLMRISIDGSDLGQCFATWENYYRTSSEQAPPPNRNTPAIMNSLQFRSSAPGFTSVGGGYLFDNVTVTTADGPGPAPCGLLIDKRADARRVSAGGRAGYQITVRNRARVTARNVWACDRIPRRMTFVSADRKLRRLGGRRCLLIPRLGAGQRAGFHVVLHVDRDTPEGTVTNIADLFPGLQPPGSPAGPAADLPARAVVKAATAIRVARALVGVKAAQASRRRRGRPGVTG